MEWRDGAKKKKREKNLMDMDNSVVMAEGGGSRGERRWRRVRGE